MRFAAAETSASPESGAPRTETPMRFAAVAAAFPSGASAAKTPPGARPSASARGPRSTLFGDEAFEPSAPSTIVSPEAKGSSASCNTASSTRRGSVGAAISSSSTSCTDRRGCEEAALSTNVLLAPFETFRCAFSPTAAALRAAPGLCSAKKRRKRCCAPASRMARRGSLESVDRSDFGSCKARRSARRSAGTASSEASRRHMLFEKARSKKKAPPSAFKSLENGFE
mmetsp:Transcript_10095/g.35644  ORF Transcript_10095/g.35644 Transcript_10095/m.35644 type:complete len:227 (+) Transcript_10095:868-1548(+)